MATGSLTVFPSKDGECVPSPWIWVGLWLSTNRICWKWCYGTPKVWSCRACGFLLLGMLTSNTPSWSLAILLWESQATCSCTCLQLQMNPVLESSGSGVRQMTDETLGLSSPQMKSSLVIWVFPAEALAIWHMTSHPCWAPLESLNMIK